MAHFLALAAQFVVLFSNNAWAGPRASVSIGQVFLGSGEQQITTVFNGSDSSTDSNYEDDTAGLVSVVLRDEADYGLDMGLRATWVPNREFDMDKGADWTLGDELQLVGSLEFGVPISQTISGHAISGQARAYAFAGPYLLFPDSDYEDLLDAFGISEHPRVGLAMGLGSGLTIPLGQGLSLSADLGFENHRITTIRDEEILDILGFSTRITEHWTGGRIWGLLGIEFAL